MGAVFRPKDFGKGYKEIIENAVKDLSPDTKDNVINLLESWEGINSTKDFRKSVKPESPFRTDNGVGTDALGLSYLVKSISLLFTHQSLVRISTLVVAIGSRSNRLLNG